MKGFDSRVRMVFILLALVFLSTSYVYGEGDKGKSKEGGRMKIGIVIYSSDPEVVWNAFRFGNFALGEHNEVKVFLLAKAVESESMDTEKFKVTELMRSFADNGGKIFACGTCLKIHQLKGTKLCPLSTINDLYKIVQESDKVLTF